MEMIEDIVRCARSMFRFCKRTKLTPSLSAHLLAIEIENNGGDEDDDEAELRLVRTNEFNIWEIVRERKNIGIAKFEKTR